MKVVFTKTGERRYKVTVERKSKASVSMDPAPGFHDRLPHDVAHFIVEDELKIAGGVFGQLAAGGNANTFHADDPRETRKARKRGKDVAKANKNDALFSEHAIFAAQSRWEKQEIIPDTKIHTDVIARIIDRFEAFSARWSKLPVGGSIELNWGETTSSKRHR
jgi:hypothetical protein